MGEGTPVNVPKVLIVDDETSILSAVQRVLRKERLEVVTTACPREALERLARERFAAVLADHRMPTTTGVELLERARKIAPDTVRIILTGYADIQAAIEAINRGGVHRYLTKPWDDEDLRAAVREAVRLFELVRENRRLHELAARQNAELNDFTRNLAKRGAQRTQQVSRLNLRLKRSFLGSLRLMARLAEMHSPLIGSHSKRVAARCDEVAEYVGLSGKDLFEVGVAATLHDVGKIGISPDILRKPEGALNRQEIEILRRHPVQGETIARMVPYLGGVPRIIRHHHERPDGRGYPDRLRGGRIPIGSRIIAVVDAYDRALNVRSGFVSMTPRKALRSVERHSTGRFSPQVLAALAACLRRGKRALNEAVEVDIQPHDLREGMILSRDLRTLRGVLLLPKDTGIRPEHVTRIVRHQQTDPVVDGIHVYRNRTVPAPQPT